MYAYDDTNDEPELQQLHHDVQHVNNRVVFDAIVITAAKASQARAYENEMKRRQQTARVPKECVIMCVADPSGCRIGSGGATLNALYCATQRISDGNHHQVLCNKRILILHSGGDSRRNPICSVTGKAFSMLPSIVGGVGNEEANQLNAPIDFLLDKLTQLCVDAPYGVWVASTDVLLDIHDDVDNGSKCTWYDSGVTGLAIPSAPTIGCGHGVYKVDENDPLNVVTMFAQKPTLATQQSLGLIRSDDTVLIDSGILFLSQEVASRFLSLAFVEPFVGCTGEGHDGGHRAFRFELYTDFLCALNTKHSFDDYLKMMPRNEDAMDARRYLYDEFHNMSFHCCVSHGDFIHLGTTSQYLEFLTRTPPRSRQSFGMVRLAACFCEYPAVNTSARAVCVNSVLQGRGTVADGALVEHSHLSGNFVIETGGIVSGIRSVGGLHCKQGVVIQQQFLSSSSSLRFHADFKSQQKPSVVFIHSVADQIKAHYADDKATFMNVSWEHFLRRFAISHEELWPHVREEARCLWNARLYPVYFGESPNDIDATLWMQYLDCGSRVTLFKWRRSVRVSFEDILRLSDPLSEFQWRQKVGFLLDQHSIVHVLLAEENRSLLTLVRDGNAMGEKLQLLKILDDVASVAPAHVAARTLCVIADVLCSFPDTMYYRRSGNALHDEFHSAYRLLDDGKVREAVQEMRKRRTQWMQSPSDVVRVARHYDGAAFRLIRRCVKDVHIDYQLVDGFDASTTRQLNKWSTVGGGSSGPSRWMVGYAAHMLRIRR